MKKKVLVSLAVVGMLLAACSSNTSNKGDSKGAQSYGIVFKNTGNPMGEKQIEGFEDAIKEAGHKSISKAPDKPTAELQITALQELVDQGVNGVAIAANDPDALEPVLTGAMAQDVSVVSFDSAVNSDSRSIHINQADAEGIGRVLCESVFDMADGAGDYAILSATSTATNQNSWIAAMADTMASDSKYAKLNLVKVAYGDDLRDKSTEETEALLQTYPNVKVIVAPSTVGLAASAKVISDKKLSDKVKVTGLGLPSEMAEYIENGVTPYMYLWNPIDIGYLTGYALMALSDGSLEGVENETFEAGRLGEKEIRQSKDGGLEVLLGDPFRFDLDNISEWKDAF